MANLTYHSGVRGNPGFQTYITGSDGVARGTVLPAFVQTDSSGVETRTRAPSSASWRYPAPSGGIANTTTAVTIKAAAGAGVRNYIESVQISWDALTNATEVTIRDGALGNSTWRFKIPAASAGSASFVFATPIQGTANTLFEVATLTASGAGGVYVNAQGWTGT